MSEPQYVGSPSDEEFRAYLDGEHGEPHPEVVAIIQDELIAAATRPAAECDCYPGGFTGDAYEGPSEDCPVHGREEQR